MDWLNKNQGAITVIAIVALGIWNIYLSTKSDTREENKITNKTDKLVTRLEERVSRAQKDIEQANKVSYQLERKLFEMEKKVAIIEERLKQATTKSLMAAGATERQALQFWNSKSNHINPLIFQLQNKANKLRQ